MSGTEEVSLAAVSWLASARYSGSGCPNRFSCFSQSLLYLNICYDCYISHSPSLSFTFILS